MLFEFDGNIAVPVCAGKSPSGVHDMATLTIRRTVRQITLSGPHGSRDLAPFFTISRDAQGLNANRAGEYQRTVVSPVKDFLFGPSH